MCGGIRVEFPDFVLCSKIVSCHHPRITVLAFTVHCCYLHFPVHMRLIHMHNSLFTTQSPQLTPQSEFTSHSSASILVMAEDTSHNQSSQFTVYLWQSLGGRSAD